VSHRAFVLSKSDILMTILSVQKQFLMLLCTVFESIVFGTLERIQVCKNEHLKTPVAILCHQLFNRTLHCSLQYCCRQKLHSRRNIVQIHAKVTRLILDKSEGWKGAATFCKLGTVLYKPWFLRKK